MEKPDYSGNSIVNLISSLKMSLGGHSHYAPLTDFELSDLYNRDIVFLVIDGLGYEFLASYGEESVLFGNMKRKITSVFPATTAAAFTSLVTGAAPRQHALTGWFMYLREIGAVTAILPFHTRAGRLSLEKSKIEFRHVCKEKSIFSGLKAKSYFIQHRAYAGSQYSCFISRGAETLSFTSMNGFFRQINRSMNLSDKRKFIFAYWDKFDSICHKRGINSKKAREHFYLLDHKISLLAGSLKKKNAALIITADHGFIDTKEREKIIRLKDHPVLAGTLITPLCGDSRVAYCYVRPDRTKEFEQYVTGQLKECCRMYRSRDLIKTGLFGLFDQDARLYDRVGDYTLIMKENYIIRDTVLGERPNKNIGNHGGTSREEMFVPLIMM